MLLSLVNLCVLVETKPRSHIRPDRPGWQCESLIVQDIFGYIWMTMWEYIFKLGRVVKTFLRNPSVIGCTPPVCGRKKILHKHSFTFKNIVIFSTDLWFTDYHPSTPICGKRFLQHSPSPYINTLITRQKEAVGRGFGKWQNRCLHTTLRKQQWKCHAHAVNQSHPESLPVPFCENFLTLLLSLHALKTPQISVWWMLSIPGSCEIY